MAMHRILIIDDAPVIRKVAGRICEGLHYEVRDVESAAQAMAICRETMPDGILIDAMLPNNSALTFIRDLRAMPGGGLARIICVFMENDVGQIARFMHAGADSYVIKPFDRIEIMEKFAE